VSPAGTVSLRHPDWSTVDETQRFGRAVFEVHHLTAARVRVAVRGDIDATNGHALGRFVERHTRVSQQLVFDLSNVDFFDCQGFTALYYVSVQCARRDVDWMIVGNRIVHRILRICDSQAELPVVGDLGAALDRLDRCAKYHHSASWAG
jgi:anti-anti-sigma factor